MYLTTNGMSSTRQAYYYKAILHMERENHTNLNWNHMIKEQEMGNIYKNGDCIKGISILFFSNVCSSI